MFDADQRVTNMVHDDGRHTPLIDTSGSYRFHGGIYRYEERAEPPRFLYASPTRCVNHVRHPGYQDSEPPQVPER